MPFCHADNTCAHCLAGMHAACTNLGMTSSGQAEYVRVTQAEGSLVKTDGEPDADLLPSLLALTDVMATGWHAAVAARVKPGDTVAVVGDGVHHERVDVRDREPAILEQSPHALQIARCEVLGPQVRDIRHQLDARVAQVGDPAHRFLEREPHVGVGAVRELHG